MIEPINECPTCGSQFVGINVSLNPYSDKIRELIDKLSETLNSQPCDGFMSTVTFDCIRGIQARDLCKKFAEDNEDWKVL